MNKEKIIEKITELYQKLIDDQYDHWYSRDTLTMYERSYEFDEQTSLEKERDDFIKQLEG